MLSNYELTSAERTECETKADGEALKGANLLLMFVKRIILYYTRAIKKKKRDFYYTIFMLNC